MPRVTKADLEQGVTILNGMFKIEPGASDAFRIETWAAKSCLYRDGREVLGGFVKTRVLDERITAYITGVRAGLALAESRKGAKA